MKGLGELAEVRRNMWKVVELIFGASRAQVVNVEGVEGIHISIIRVLLDSGPESRRFQRPTPFPSKLCSPP